MDIFTSDPTLAQVTCRLQLQVQAVTLKQQHQQQRSLFLYTRNLFVVPFGGLCGKCTSGGGVVKRQQLFILFSLNINYAPLWAPLSHPLTLPCWGMFEKMLKIKIKTLSKKKTKRVEWHIVRLVQLHHQTRHHSATELQPAVEWDGTKIRYEWRGERWSGRYF